MVEQLRERAALLWDIDPDAVDWNNGHALPAGANGGDFEPLSLAELAAKAAQTGGPITAHVSVNAQGAAPAFATHVCDVEVDEETGRVEIIRYTAVQDAGRAIHPGYVEGQMQGGVAQGIGWALNEEYIFDASGRLDNAGFLDYRMPVASDLPMIDTVVVEVPNDAHPARRPRRRRSADRAADGRGRQRDPRRRRTASAGTADVAAEGTCWACGRDQRWWGHRIGPHAGLVGDGLVPSRARIHGCGRGRRGPQTR